MKKATVLIIMLILLSLAACTGQEAAPTPTISPPTPTEPEVYYSLSVSADPQEGGAVAPVNETLLAGVVVQVEAKPAVGYEFTGWTGAFTSGSHIIPILMKGDRQLTAHFKKIITKTPAPTPTPTPVPCRRPADVTRDDVGKLIEVCGRVTNFGNIACPDCVYGAYSFLMFENEFMLISYDWFFINEWVNSCLIMADTVELLGNNPIFVFKKGDGYAGSECYRNEDGMFICESGDYFQDWEGCE